MDNSTDTHLKVPEGFIGQKMTVLPPDRIKAAARNPLSKFLYATAIGYYPHASYHDRERKNGSEQYILLYCVDGKGWIRTGGSEIRLTAHTFFILPKKTAHHYGSSGKEPWSIYWIHFSGDHAALLYARYQRHAAGSALSVPYDEARTALFNQLATAIEHDTGEENIELNHIQLMQFISSFIYNTHSAPDENDPINRSIALMRQHLSSNFSVKELAAQVHYSVSRYSELFKQRTGYAPLQYFMRLKIQRACQYLYFTRMTVKQVSHETGFDDPYYFSRVFKKQVGLAPGRYRGGMSSEQ